jgi:hypothetical protein
MVSLLKEKTLVIRESKIVHKSPVIQNLARFVTEEAVCLMFNLSLEDIYTVECWRYIVYVHAKGVSKFLSYADFPPIVGVEPPTQSECVKWRKRWRKQLEPKLRKQAPACWAKFFTAEFFQALNESVLSAWGKLVGTIKFAFDEETLQKLRKSYSYGRALLTVNS